MKLQLFTVLLIVAGAYALPRANDVVIVAESSNELIQGDEVEDRVSNLVEILKVVIQRFGLDPLEVERRDIVFIPGVSGFVENLKSNGASDIRINNLEYSYLFNRIRLDVSIPEINFSLGNSSFLAQVLDNEFEGQLKGSLKIKSIRLAGVLHVRNTVQGPVLRSVSVNFSLGGIESDLQMVAQGDNISENVNKFFAERIPFLFEDNRDDINRVIEDFITDIFDGIWPH